MARNTRQRRRQRRARSQEGEPQQGVTKRARTRQQQVRPSAQPPKTQTGSRRVPGGGFKRFVAESWAELKKVDWPGQSQVIQATTVVLIACVIVGTFLFAADYVFKHLVQNVFLGQ